MASFNPPPSPFTPPPNPYDFSAYPKRIILEYVGAPGQRIYGFGTITEDGKITQDQEQTFGSLPSTPCDVMKANGALVSYEDYCAEIDAEV